MDIMIFVYRALFIITSCLLLTNKSDAMETKNQSEIIQFLDILAEAEPSAWLLTLDELKKNFPQGMTEVYCCENNISSLPELHQELTLLHCNKNFLIEK